MSHRFFIPSSWLTPPTVILYDEVAHQIRTVLRLRVGDTVVLLDNTGQAYEVRLTYLHKRSIQADILNQYQPETEPPIHLTLYQGTLKAQKFEWVLQKGTEIGVSQFVPLICERSIVRGHQILAKKQARWQKIIQEAAEQSGRAKLPTLAEAMVLGEMVSPQWGGSSLIMPWELATIPLKTVLQTEPRPNHISLMIGPEGGFTAEEADHVQQLGGQVVSLGPRILRAETAAVVACGVVMYEVSG